MAKKISTISLLRTTTCFCVLLLLPNAASGVMIPDDQLDEDHTGKCQGEDGVCLLSLRRSMTKRAIVGHKEEAGIQEKAEEELLQKEMAATDTAKQELLKAQAKNEKTLSKHTEQAKEMKDWVAKQKTLNTKAEASGSDFAKFLTLAKNEQGACHARLLHAKRALDGLKKEVQGVTDVITAGEEDLAAETESLRVSTMNLRALEDRKEKALEKCDEDREDAQNKYDKYKLELDELQAMSMSPSIMTEVVIEHKSHLPHWLPKDNRHYCAGEELVCRGEELRAEGVPQGCKHLSATECQHACGSMEACGGYTTYSEESGAPHTCLLFASCESTKESQYELGVQSYEKGPNHQMCEEHYDTAVNYRGCHDITNSGQTCIPWKDVGYMYEMYTDEQLDEFGLRGGHNFCRDPNSLWDLPWCYTGFDDDGMALYYECGEPQYDENGAVTEWAIPDWYREKHGLTGGSDEDEYAGYYDNEPAANSIPEKGANNAAAANNAGANNAVAANNAGANNAVAANNAGANNAVAANNAGANTNAVLASMNAAAKSAMQKKNALLEVAASSSGEKEKKATKNKKAKEGMKTGSTPVLDTKDKNHCMAFLEYEQKKKSGTQQPENENGENEILPGERVAGEAGTGRANVTVEMREAPPSSFDECGCKPGTGWNREAEQCLPDQGVDDAAKACCLDDKLPSLDPETNQPICKVVHCGAIHDHPACNAKFGCGWENSTQTCTQKFTCCEYHRMEDQAVEGAEKIPGFEVQVSPGGQAQETARTRCDATTGCIGVQKEKVKNAGDIYTMIKMPTHGGEPPEGMNRHPDMYLGAFEKTGCKGGDWNFVPGFNWDQMPDQNVLNDMYAYCSAVNSGTAKPGQVDFCCGNPRTKGCAVSCEKQTEFSLPERKEVHYVDAPKTLTFLKGHCHRAMEGSCPKVIKGPPLDPETCEEKQEDLRNDYTLAVTAVKEEVDNAKEDMSIETLEECRKLQISSFQAPLTELSSAVDQSVEVCEKASKTIQDLTAPLVDLQHDLDDLERDGGLIEQLQEECQNTQEVSTYLTDVRNAIEGLQECPGNVGIVTTHGLFEGEE